MNVTTNNDADHKKSGVNLRLSLLGIIVGALFLAGCKPAGPRALWQGKRLIEKERYEDAAVKLVAATSLLPTNAQAWNYLGLARHYGSEPAGAEEAYRRALMVDHDLSEAHFNLGCLLLEQGKPDLARAELTAYTLRRGPSALASCKLGWAELQLAKGSDSSRHRSLAAAEKHFIDALLAEPGNVEALNGLGLARFHKGQAESALENFQKATRLQPRFGPAIINAAIVEQTGLRNLPAALARYNEYLSLKPPSGDHVAVRGVIAEIERSIAEERAASVAPAPAPTRVPPPRTNSVANLPVSAPSAVVTKSERIANPVKQTSISSKTSPATNRAPSSVATSSSKSLPPETVAIAPITTDLVQIASEPALKIAGEPARELTRSQTSGEFTNTARLNTVADRSSASNSAGTSRLAQKGFLQRLNPFQTASKGDAPTNTPKTSAVPFTLSTGDAIARNGEAAHYLYARPGKPGSGDRKAAQVFFAQGLAAQQAHSLEDAIHAYYQAIQSDPEYFDAYYNLGLTAGEAGELSLSLRSYEYALSAQPDSVDARYNFALNLKQVSCIRDALVEFEKIVATHPKEARALLALGNIYAQNLRQNGKAREYYLKALEANPHLAEAGSIRYWLAENP